MRKERVLLTLVRQSCCAKALLLCEGFVAQTCVKYEHQLYLRKVEDQEDNRDNRKCKKEIRNDLIRIYASVTVAIKTK